ncbi:uncharacterized protein KNAG_0K02690 [Huiozyma naganishii CBS 8797]|uniref:ATP-dependent RNA helicase n=1 Tax=Huiozyma naganishii (strain ATCC MYA-139 / BCRC 22969 / CBS 8797 / KCTC 17520 / NBRC 10181 / NCYC 3082 / Yp74L-3) TaxID=1071383 RepID=J7S3H8_HUIN7|nr:hypothetical protein KNAG_0K02690 [Kazachstania naganishii CBS 8797]CCK72632.1 hypothetical protein KNAG_0K02690 [Kazachstania naganishii CBS 8797]
MVNGTCGVGSTVYSTAFSTSISANPSSHRSSSVSSSVSHSFRTSVVTNSSVASSIMWMVYIGAGGPYRFPEIQKLKFASNDRNIFADNITRCLAIRTVYTKAQVAKRMTKHLDTTTSHFLFFFIMIVVPLRNHIAGSDFAGMSRDLFDEMGARVQGHPTNAAGPLGGAMSDKDFSQQVIKSFLFVDVLAGKLLKYDFFNKRTRDHPCSVHKEGRLTFRELRHGIIFFMRKHTNVAQIIAGANAVEEYAGHTATTGRQVYAAPGTVIDHNESEEAIGDHQIALAWHRFLGLEMAKSVVTVTEKDKAKKEYRPYGAMGDLTAAGRLLYNDAFQFRKGQQDIAIDVFLGTEQLIPVQALPGYGKTALFQIPLIALKKKNPLPKVVSFVFVPYIPLKANMIDRLRAKGQLEVGDVAELLKNGPNVGEDALIADVYVGAFHEMGTVSCKELIDNWYKTFKNTILGLVVLDEFHNFETELTFRAEVYQLIDTINLGLAWKVLVLSGTIGRRNFAAPLKRLGFKKPLTTELTFESKSFIRNLVEELPLGNSVKWFGECASSDQCLKKAVALVNHFLASEENSKVILVCRTREHVGLLATDLTPHDPLSVHGRMSGADKEQIMRRFIQDPAKRVLVGTKLVSEGIDVQSLALVILVDYLPSIGEFVQTAGRIRGDGLCLVLWSSACRNDPAKDLNPGCLTPQLNRFYELSQEGHVGCCGNLERVNPLSVDLAQRVFPNILSFPLLRKDKWEQFETASLKRARTEQPWEEDSAAEESELFGIDMFIGQPEMTECVEGSTVDSSDEENGRTPGPEIRPHKAPRIQSGDLHRPERPLPANNRVYSSGEDEVPSLDAAEYGDAELWPSPSIDDGMPWDQTQQDDAPRHSRDSPVTDLIPGPFYSEHDDATSQSIGQELRAAFGPELSLYYFLDIEGTYETVMKFWNPYESNVGIPKVNEPKFCFVCMGGQHFKCVCPEFTSHKQKYVVIVMQLLDIQTNALLRKCSDERKREARHS